MPQLEARRPNVYGVKVELLERGEVDDVELSSLHARAFGGEANRHAWRKQLEAHSLAWVVARAAGRLVGFVNVAWDGGAHAFLVDTVVEPTLQGRGIGRRLVMRASTLAARAGCRWLHVDFETSLLPFYRDTCGFRVTMAGLIDLTDRGKDQIEAAG